MNGVDLLQWDASIVKEEWTDEVFDVDLMRNSSANGNHRYYQPFLVMKELFLPRGNKLWIMCHTFCNYLFLLSLDNR